MESKAVSLIDEMPLMVLSLASRSLEMTVPSASGAEILQIWIGIFSEDAG